MTIYQVINQTVIGNVLHEFVVSSRHTDEAAAQFEADLFGKGHTVFALPARSIWRGMDRLTPAEAVRQIGIEILIDQMDSDALMEAYLEGPADAVDFVGLYLTRAPSDLVIS